ncbi:MAG: F0F1 ATP synthase subunit B [Bifidobacteriaceae bacterium]|nr:F0F1 ATP synthase subunit B [Bifidobacteriaceae bacterium]
MENNGNANGVDIFIPKLPEIFWSAVVIIIIAIAFYKYILPRLNKTLEQRSDKIEGQIQTANDLSKSAEKFKVQYETKLFQVNDEALGIKNQAQKEADLLIEEAKAQASVDSANLVASAHKTIQANQVEAFATLKKDIGSLASEFATEIIKDKVAPTSEQLKSIDKFLDNLEKPNGSK